MSTSLKQARFIAGAVNLSHAPADVGHEVAFVGRSNSGKSSAINAITHNSKLARVSKLPGRTQQINFFEVTGQQRIVDLPGYGFAKVPKEVREQWKEMVESYIAHRETLRGLVLVTDSRLGLTDLDWTMLDWCGHVSVPVHVLLSKCDKLTRSAGMVSLRTTHQLLSERGSEAQAQLFSALKGDGLAEVERVINRWLQLAPGHKKTPAQ